MPLLPGDQVLTKKKNISYWFGFCNGWYITLVPWIKPSFFLWKLSSINSIVKARLTEHQSQCIYYNFSVASTLWYMIYLLIFGLKLKINNGVHCLFNSWVFSVFVIKMTSGFITREHFYLGLLKICLKVSQVCHTPKQCTTNFKSQRECKLRQTFQFAIISSYNLRQVLGLLLITIPENSY